MTGAEIDTFTARLARFTDKGLSLDAAASLADKLVIRDRESDDRRLCLECVNLAGRAGAWRCWLTCRSGAGAPALRRIQRTKPAGNNIMTKAKTPAKNSKTLQLSRPPDQTTAQALSRAALRPSINGASVIEAFQGNVMGKEVELGELVAGLADSCRRVKDGDLSTLEAMLVSQATALQTMFTSLARRAANQEHLRQYETFMGLALKAQAQSRVTISALVDLKFPRQATFVKQANIAHGPQQVNNSTQAGADSEPSPHTHGKETARAQNKLLEADHGQPGKRMDSGTAHKAERSYQAVATVEAVHRAKKSSGKGGSGWQCL